MKQYLLSVHMIDGEPGYASDEEIQAAFADVEVFNAELQQEGAWVFAGGLHPADVATVVRIQDGDTLITDGPFAETKEHIGGFWVVKAPDLDAALAIAERGARACRQPVEVRPFQDEAEE